MSLPLRSDTRSLPWITMLLVLSATVVCAAPLVEPRQPNGDGTVVVGGDLKQWHKVTLTLDGPFAHERDNEPNPFTDVAMSVTFTHESGARDTRFLDTLQQMARPLNPARSLGRSGGLTSRPTNRANGTMSLRCKPANS